MEKHVYRLRCFGIYDKVIERVGEVERRNVSVFRTFALGFLILARMYFDQFHVGLKFKRGFSFIRDVD